MELLFDLMYEKCNKPGFFQDFFIKYLLKNPSSLTLGHLMQRNDSTVVTLAQVETY